jgi:nitroreductase
MNVLETVKSRRTIHQYRPGSLPEGLVERALEAALRAPNHKLTNPWRFCLVGERVRSMLEEIAVDVKRRSNPDLTDVAAAAVRRKIAAPSALLVVGQLRDADPFRDRENYASIACAIQNLSLVLWSEGVGSKWSTGAVTRDSATYRALELDSGEVEIVGFVWMGYPVFVPETGRLPLGTVLRMTE